MHVNIMILYNYIYVCMYVCMYVCILLYIYTQAGAFRIGIGFLEGLLKRVSLKAP